MNAPQLVDEGPEALGTNRARWLLVATVAGSGLALLPGASVNVAVKALGTERGADVAGLRWRVDGYTSALASLILWSGSMLNGSADRPAPAP